MDRSTTRPGSTSPGPGVTGEKLLICSCSGFGWAQHPRVCITTTPRTTELIKSLVADPKTQLTRGTTYDNRIHLSPAFFSRDHLEV